MPKKSSQTGIDVEASDPVTVAPGKVNAQADRPSKHAPVKFRGVMCEVSRVTKNVQTGAVYDHVEYQRQVTNRRDNSVSSVTLTRKIRRPGTGGVGREVKEIEIESEV